MKTVLITGANKGIGLETARQLAQQGYHVFIGSRDQASGQQAAEQLRAEGLAAVEAVQLDVRSDDSVQAARAAIGQKTVVLDALVNNAAITGGLPQTALGTSVAAFQDVFDTNLFGVARVTQAFIDLLRHSPEPRIVNVGSSGASLTLHSDPSWKYYNHKGAVYPASKAALHMYTIVLAYELRDTAFQVNAVDPGFTATDLNNHRGTGTVEDAAARIAKYVLTGPEGPTGKFISEEHNPITGEIPW
ncbi:SDR family NAD(P)-dependent oxidoreductase [Hymenobacter wooponensis]|uniref:SDR family NAD(P)-dependent oxidoreductase n=1 Tax=Hymenobacter wooponensis TaxID=1525360 RepID=A0A4Z0MI38_9BACT|nr:SDR family NAD(P)-dependent oxidoreductase [Hymenobacter wooponensis]TGD79472.1 SDR family NAD(P)-dependent oxidoreductase [Hymenobacter wooponensis]